MIFPSYIAKIFSTLDARGIKAYVVGGAVRDMIMGKEPVDYDMAAECYPDDLLLAFEGERYFDTAIRFGTLNLITDRGIVEITCCRRETDYTDCRRPDSVEFCRDIELDLCRRDFTVNAMAMDKEGNVTDLFDGKDDIEKKIIRTVGDADVRFSEDALRIMRALRFSATLGYEIEDETKRAIHENAYLLKSISSERIFEELKKLIMGDYATQVLLEYPDVICKIIPELAPSVGFDQKNPHHIYTVYEHIVRSVGACPKDVNIRLCMLLHDIAKPLMYTEDDKGIGHFYGHPDKSEEMARGILTRLHADSETVKKVCFLIKYHDTRPAATKKSLLKYLTKVGFDAALELIDVRRADLFAQSPAYHDQFEYLAESKRIIEELQNEGACISVMQLEIGGNDLIELGLSPGPQIGEILRELLKKVISESIKNERTALLKAARKMIK